MSISKCPECNEVMEFTLGHVKDLEIEWGKTDTNGPAFLNKFRDALRKKHYDAIFYFCEKCNAFFIMPKKVQIQF